MNVIEKLTCQLQNKEYLMPCSDTGLCCVSNFFQNILLKTAQLCDVRLQNCDVTIFVSFFFWTTFYVVCAVYAVLSETGEGRLHSTGSGST